MLSKEQAEELKRQYEAEYQKLEDQLTIEDAKQDWEIDKEAYNNLENQEQALYNKIDDLEVIIDDYDEIINLSANFIQKS